MMPSIADKTRTLRDEAWQAVVESDAFVAFKALDDAFIRMGGTSRIASDPSPVIEVVKQVIKTTARRMAESRKLSHAEAAEIALENFGEPMITPILLEHSVKSGAEVGGSDPLNNFRSTISKDERFYSVRKDGISYWWVKGKSLPSGWNEPAGPSLLAEPAGSSLHSGQEGGDGHAPATT